MKTRKHDSRRGSAVVELALSGTLLMLLTFGAADFALIFFDGVVVANSAGSSAFYGADDNIRAGDFNAIGLRAEEDAEGDVGAVSPSVNQICTCPGGTAFACVEYGDVTCSGYGAPRAYVRVVVEDPYESISGFTLLPDAMIRREAIMRVR